MFYEKFTKILIKKQYYPYVIEYTNKKYVLLNENYNY